MCGVISTLEEIESALGQVVGEEVKVGFLREGDTMWLQGNLGTEDGPDTGPLSTSLKVEMAGFGQVKVCAPIFLFTHGPRASVFLLFLSGPVSQRPAIPRTCKSPPWPFDLWLLQRFLSFSSVGGCLCPCWVRFKERIPEAARLSRRPQQGGPGSGEYSQVVQI